MKKRFLALVLALALAVPVPAALAAEPEEDGSVPAAGESLGAASEEPREVPEEGLEPVPGGETLEEAPEKGPAAAAGEETPVRGSCGENAQWYFDAEAGRLRIHGTGAMQDFQGTSRCPWYPYQKNIRSVVVEGGITRLGNYAFCGCEAMTSIYLPESLEEIGRYAVAYCKSLTSLALPDSVASIEYAAFYSCSSLKWLTLSDGLTEIPDLAFSGCAALETVSIPDGVTVIKKAFYGTGLREVSLPEGLLELGGFEACANLKQIEIPQGVTVIGSSAFSGSGLTSVTIPGSVRSIGEFTFSGCEGLKSAVLEEGVTAVSESMFRDCGSLRQVTLPDSLTSIDHSAFYNCTGLEEIALPEGLKLIEARAFENTGLSAVTVPGAVTTMGAWAFTGCQKLVTAVLGSGRRDDISASAFSGCHSLTTVFIPKSVRMIYENSFEDCPSLRHIYYEGTEAEWNALSSRNGLTWPENLTVHYENSETPVSTPRILALSPVSGGVSPGTVLDITFDREIAERPGNRNSPLVLPDNGFQILRLSDGQAVYTAGEFSWSQFTYGASRSVLRISPSNIRNHLIPGEEYAVVLGAGFVSFTDGTASPELPSGRWTFTASQPPDAVRLSDTTARYEGAVELSDGTCVLAAAYSRGGGPMTAASQGAFSASDGMIAFDSSVRQGDRLFLLEPGTYIPLAKPILLE